MRPGALRERFGDGLAQVSSVLRPTRRTSPSPTVSLRPVRILPHLRGLDRVAVLIRGDHGEDDPLRRHDLAIDARAPAVVSIGSPNAGVERAAGRRSILGKWIAQPRGAYQPTSCSGSVHALNTRSRGASKTRVMRTCLRAVHDGTFGAGNGWRSCFFPLEMVFRWRMLPSGSLNQARLKSPTRCSPPRDEPAGRRRARMVEAFRLEGSARSRRTRRRRPR